MIAAVRRVLDEWPEVQRLAHDQAQLLREKYQWKAVAERTLEVYREVHASRLEETQKNF